jgi:hypothetical protein
MLRHLARYTYPVAISNRRLLALDAKGVTFWWKDYRIEGPERYQIMTLGTHEFIRRFLIHVLPPGLSPHSLLRFDHQLSPRQESLRASARCWQFHSSQPMPSTDKASQRPPGIGRREGIMGPADKPGLSAAESRTAFAVTKFALCVSLRAQPALGGGDKRANICICAMVPIGSVGACPVRPAIQNAFSRNEIDL